MEYRSLLVTRKGYLSTAGKQLQTYTHRTTIHSSSSVDKSMLDQVEVTIERIRGYLDKSGASAWWKKWLANVCADKTEREATGTACTLAIGHLLLHIIIHIIVSSR